MPEFKSKKEFLKNLSGCDDMSAAKRNYPKALEKIHGAQIEEGLRSRGRKGPKIS